MPRIIDTTTSHTVIHCLLFFFPKAFTCRLLSFLEVLQNKLAKNELELSKVNQNISNLDIAVDEITSTCCKLGSLWREAELELCQRIQNLLFPNGILWDKVLGSYRTIDENKALAVIQAISTSCKKENEGKSKNFPSTLLLYAVRDSNPGPID